MFEICGMQFCSVFCETLWSHLLIWLIATFQFGWLPFFDAADCQLSVRLIAIFWCGWMPPFNAADCHLSMRLIATFQFGWLPFSDPADATLHLIWPECHITLAWMPIYSCGLGAVVFIRPECHIPLAWVPVYSFGLSATLFIWPGCQFIHLAWVPFINKVWQVSHSFPASLTFYPSLPICNLPGLSATLIPHGWCATFIHLTCLALFERTSYETFCQKLDICWKPFCETLLPGVGIWEACRKLILKRENSTGFRSPFLKKKSPAVQRSVIVRKMDRGTVKFLMLLRGPCFLLSPICCPELKGQFHNEMHLFEPFWLYKSLPDGTFYNSPFLGCLTRF